MMKIIWLAILLFSINLLPCAAQEETIPVQSPIFWEGTKLTEQELHQAPEDMFISNKKDWVKLWQAWLGGKTPKIDFKKKLVLFCATLTPNRCSLSWRLASGDLKLKAFTTLIGSSVKTYDFKIIVIESAGIKTINGKPIKK